MGQSTDALLMFGVSLGDGEDMEWPPELVEPDDGDAGYPDLQGWIDRRAGLQRPQTEDYKDPTWSAYWQAQRAAKAACPIELISHCSSDYPMWVVALRDTVQRANRGHPTTPTMREISDADRAALKGFCEEFGLPWSEPAWVLASDWS